MQVLIRSEWGICYWQDSIGDMQSCRKFQQVARMYHFAHAHVPFCTNVYETAVDAGFCGVNEWGGLVSEPPRGDRM